MGVFQQKTEVRPVRTNDIRLLLRLIDTAWRVYLRIVPNELRYKIEHIPGFVAEDSVGIRGFMMMEPLYTGAGLIVAAGLRDTWGIEPFLNLLLPPMEQTARTNEFEALVCIGSAPWLIDPLQNRGFEIREWIISYERSNPQPPPPPEKNPAQLRTAHSKDLSQLLSLDNLVFDHIWHKSAGNFNEALAQADSFTVAIVNNQIVAYQWCEVYGQQAHLTRLAVHPGYQGRGIGAQLLYRAISDALALGANFITLNTQEKNKRSQLLYEKFGFVSTQQRMPVLWKVLKD